MPRLWVGGLTNDVKAADIAGRFVSFGKVRSVTLAKGKDGNHPTLRLFLFHLTRNV
jgi:hypothetical protein